MVFGEAQSSEKLKPGDVLTVNGKKVSVVEVDITPVIQNNLSSRGTYDPASNPKYRKLRETEHLDQLVANAKTEFEKQVLVLDWAQRRLPKFGSPTSKASGPIEIIKAADEGNTFFCSHYNCIFSGAATSMGWITRSIALHVGNKPHGKGFAEHSVSEIWSNQYRKWIFVDPLYGMYVTKNDQPLNIWEVRQEYNYGDASSLRFVLGAGKKVYKISDLPVAFAQHPGYGTLELNLRSFDLLAMIGYLPGNNIIDKGSVNYGEMYITTDTLASKVTWHTRIHPQNPAKDPYYPMQQADLSFAPAPKGLAVTVKTNTPNFSNYRYRINEGKWIDGEPGLWKLRKGKNTLELKAVNAFGVEGLPSRVVLKM
jgi:hypothetical protein